MSDASPSHRRAQHASIATIAALRGAQLALAGLGDPIAGTESVLLSDSVGRVLALPVRVEADAALHLVDAPGAVPRRADELAAGMRIEAPHVPMLAASGLRVVDVHRRLRAGVVTLLDAAADDAGADTPAGRQAMAARTTGATLAALLGQLGAQVFTTTCRQDPDAADGERLAQHLRMLVATCDLVVLGGFLAPSPAAAVAAALAGGAAPARVRDVVVRPIGTVQVVEGAAVLAVALSGHVGSAVSAFTALVAPLVRRLQGRRDLVAPTQFARMAPGMAVPCVGHGLFRVREVLEPGTRRPVLHPCFDAGTAVSLATASGLAWRPADLPPGPADSVALYPFHTWLA